MTHNYNSQGMLSTRAVLGTVYHGEFSWGSEHTYANVHSLYFLGCGNDRVAYCLPLSCCLLSQRSAAKGTAEELRKRQSVNTNQRSHINLFQQQATLAIDTFILLHSEWRIDRWYPDITYLQRHPFCNCVSLTPF